MILIEPFFVTPNFSNSNYLLYNYNNLMNTLYWSGFNSAINIDIFTISSIEGIIGLPIDILSNSDERKLIRNINLYKVKIYQISHT